MTIKLKPAYRRAIPFAVIATISLAAGGLVAGGAVTAMAADGAIQPTAPKQHIPDFADLTAEVRPAVVSITNKLKPSQQESGTLQLPFGFAIPQQQQATEARGSGFIISPDGYIVTNNHVVNDEQSLSVQLNDGTEYPAHVVGTDSRTDLAVIKIDAGKPLPYLKLGNSDKVRVGEWVVAVGNPFGLGGTVTAGILSARGRDIGDGPYDSFLQIDAPINEGNSGGPLFNQDGEVIGVNSAIISPSGGSVGIGFAIPSNTVKTVVAQLEKYGKVTRGYLGVQAQEITPDMGKALNLPGGANQKGALVASVEPNSPASTAGLQPGDVITGVNDETVTNPRDLAVDIAGIAPGSTAHIKLLRNGHEQTITVTLATLPNDKNSGSTGTSNTGADSLGLQLTALTPALRQQLGLSADQGGVMISEVTQGSPADNAGLQQGDVIVSVGATPVNNVDQATKAIRTQRSKDHAVALRVMRNGEVSFVVVSGQN